MHNYKLTKDAKALLHLYNTEDGGKKNSISSGYMSPAKIRNDQMNDVRFFLINRDKLQPGETCEVFLGFLCPELVRDYLEVGKKFQIWEGKFMGEIEILEILEIDERITSLENNT